MHLEKDKWARRAVYSLILGVSAFFALFNSKHRWITLPEYNRLKGVWLEPFLPAMELYLPTLVLILGAAFLLSAAYCLRRYIIATKSGGSAA